MVRRVCDPCEFDRLPGHDLESAFAGRTLSLLQCRVITRNGT
jgi:hypothetical protein